MRGTTGMSKPRTQSPRLRAEEPHPTVEHLGGTVGDRHHSAPLDRHLVAFLQPARAAPARKGKVLRVRPRRRAARNGHRRVPVAKAKPKAAPRRRPAKAKARARVARKAAPRRRPAKGKARKSKR
jgi:hypothetical protein